MWLLDTKTAKLKHFDRPEDVRRLGRGYAILSHRWGDVSEEDTFQKVQDAAKRCEENERRAASPSLHEPPTVSDALRASLEQQRRIIDDLHRKLDALVEKTGLALPLDPQSPPHEVISETPVSGSEPGTPTESETQVEFNSRSVSPEPESSSSRLTSVDDGPPSYATVANANEWSGKPDKATLLSTTNPRDLVSNKLRRFLIQAERDGFEWAWADTACIDKTSSAELSESINSMFRYYSLSTVCYAYLSDVSPPSYRGDFPNGFKRSQWHRRGWTLQELIAPKTVSFWARDWTSFGTKFEHAEKLERITDIPAAVLRFEKSFADVSVAERMFWASKRQTTRVEDEAYCLFGLFGVNMSTLYGEGRHAFYRLQEEIMKTSVDTTLFAGGRAEIVDDMMELEEHLDMISDRPATRHLLGQGPSNFRRALDDTDHLVFDPKEFAKLKLKQVCLAIRSSCPSPNQLYADREVEGGLFRDDPGGRPRASTHVQARAG